MHGLPALLLSGAHDKQSAPSLRIGVLVPGSTDSLDSDGAYQPWLLTRNEVLKGIQSANFACVNKIAIEELQRAASSTEYAVLYAFQGSKESAVIVGAACFATFPSQSTWIQTMCDLSVSLNPMKVAPETVAGLPKELKFEFDWVCTAGGLPPESTSRVKGVARSLVHALRLVVDRLYVDPATPVLLYADRSPEPLPPGQMSKWIRERVFLTLTALDEAAQKAWTNIGFKLLNPDYPSFLRDREMWLPLFPGGVVPEAPWAHARLDA